MNKELHIRLSFFDVDTKTRLPAPQNCGGVLAAIGDTVVLPGGKPFLVTDRVLDLSYVDREPDLAVVDIALHVAEIHGSVGSE